jgi:hypothetical protein
MGGTVRNFSHTNPDQLDVRFDFVGLPVYWSHKEWGFTSPTPDNNIGVFYFGEKATVFAGDLGWEVYPAKGKKISHGSVRFDPGAPENVPVYTKMFTGMFSEFAQGIRKKTNAGITNTLEEAQKTTACVIYGDMAFRTQSNLVIDAATMDIKNNKEAQAMLKREYRPPYQHPYVD